MRAGSRTETPRERLRKRQVSASGSLLQLSPREATGWLRQRSRSSLFLSVLLCSVEKKAECNLAAVPSAVRFACRCYVCLFTHAHPTMPSISLVFMHAIICACAALCANVAGRIGNRLSLAESAFSACIGLGLSQSS